MLLEIKNNIKILQIHFSSHTSYIVYLLWGGAADCYLKPIVCMQKRVIRYVCRVPALTTTNPLFKKTGVQKLNDVYKLQICKLMRNTITGFNVGHNRFTFASSIHSHSTRFSKKKKNFITKRPNTRLGLNCFIYLDPKFWSSVPENFKNLKKRLF